MKARNPLVVEVLRGPVVESTHQVMAVIADRRGLVTGSFGNVDYPVMPRSSIKPLQAIPFVESGALEKFSLDDRMIAMACSSHAGEKQHLVVLAEWLQKIGQEESVLHCGADWPRHEKTLHEMLKKSLKASPLIHNCAGKHLGMISTALAAGEDPTGYAEHGHPVQKRIRMILKEASRFEHESAVWGVDGCGIPTYAIPLQALAVAGAMLVGDSLKDSRRTVVRRILDAMKKYPVLVSGTDEFSSALMEKTGGRVIIKSGAEGVYLGWLPERAQCVALKVADGHRRAAEVAMASVLRALGGLTEAEYLELRRFTMPDILNSRGDRVGEIRLERKG